MKIFKILFLLSTLTSIAYANSFDTLGHFSLSSNSLNVNPGSTGTVTVTNTGQGSIANMRVSIPPSLTKVIGGTCLTTKTLLINAACTLTYQVTKAIPQTTGVALTFEGQNVDNAPSTLTISVGGLLYFPYNNADNSNKLGYVACPISANNGSVGYCVPKQLALTGQTGHIQNISVTPDGSHAYLTGNEYSRSLFACKVNDSAQFVNCNTVTVPADVQTDHISFLQKGDKAYFYSATALPTRASVCDVDTSTLALSNCVDSKFAVSNGTAVGYDSIKLNSAGTSAYVVYEKSDAFSRIALCHIDPRSGTFHDCSDTFANPANYVIGNLALDSNNANAIFTASNITDTSLIYSCPINSDGTFEQTACKTNPINNNPFSPAFIALDTVGNYLYYLNNANYLQIGFFSVMTNGDLNNGGTTGTFGTDYQVNEFAPIALSPNAG
jgi:hypothetical protein